MKNFGIKKVRFIQHSSSPTPSHTIAPYKRVLMEDQEPDTVSSTTSMLMAGLIQRKVSSIDVMNERAERLLCGFPLAHKVVASLQLSALSLITSSRKDPDLIGE